MAQISLDVGNEQPGGMRSKEVITDHWSSSDQSGWHIWGRITNAHQCPLIDADNRGNPADGRFLGTIPGSPADPLQKGLVISPPSPPCVRLRFSLSSGNHQARGSVPRENVIDNPFRWSPLVGFGLRHIGLTLRLDYHVSDPCGTLTLAGYSTKGEADRGCNPQEETRDPWNCRRFLW